MLRRGHAPMPSAVAPEGNRSVAAAVLLHVSLAGSKHGGHEVAVRDQADHDSWMASIMVPEARRLRMRVVELPHVDAQGVLQLGPGVLVVAVDLHSARLHRR